MNQAILFNDDLTFDQQQNAWRITALLSGRVVCIYFHWSKLNTFKEVGDDIRFDLEDKVELWLEDNEPEGEEIHLNID